MFNGYHSALLFMAGHIYVKFLITYNCRCMVLVFGPFHQGQLVPKIPLVYDLSNFSLMMSFVYILFV